MDGALICLFALLLVGCKQGNVRGETKVETGLENKELGVMGVPIITYFDEGNLIMYDSQGLLIFNFDSECIVDFINFQEIKMNELQGDNYTTVEISEDGKFERIYNSSEKYLYSVNQKNGKSEGLFKYSRF